MTCEVLAQRYAVESGFAVPSASAGLDARGAWLYSQEWGCYIDGQYANAEACDQQHVVVSPGFDTVGVPKTTLTESGFASWVNDRGPKCINGLTGVWVNALASATQPHQQVYCATACLQFDQGCFECVKGVLENKENKLENACPALYNGTTLTSVDTSVMAQAVACVNCIGSNSANLTRAVETKDPATGQTQLGAVYQNPGFDNMWCCMTGDFPLGAGAIAGIVVAALVVVAVIIGVTVYFVRKKQKAKAPNTK